MWFFGFRYSWQSTPHNRGCSLWGIPQRDHLASDLSDEAAGSDVVITALQSMARLLVPIGENCDNEQLSHDRSRTECHSVWTDWQSVLQNALSTVKLPAWKLFWKNMCCPQWRRCVCWFRPRMLKSPLRRRKPLPNRYKRLPHPLRFYPRKPSRNWSGRRSGVNRRKWR